MYRFSILIFLSANLFLAAKANSVPSLSAESVWVESDLNVNSIRLSVYQTDEWNLSAKPLYSSEEAITSVALSTDLDGNKILIWTQQRRAKTVLMSMSASRLPSGEVIWSEPELFSEHGHENFAATMVVDKNGITWLFWSSTTKDYSDIVMQTFDGVSWSPATQVNKPNEVPDDLPQARITDTGAVQVDWNSFDIENSRPVLNKKIFKTNLMQPKNNELELVDDVDPDEVPTPPNLPPYTQALLHFPANVMIQSRRTTNTN